MTIAQHRFCINRKIAPSLNIESFFRLVHSLGLNKVELRNDLPGGKVTDDLSARQVRSHDAASAARPRRTARFSRIRA